MHSATVRRKIEEAAKELIKLNEGINDISEALKKLHQTENPNDLDQSMKNYRKSKENLLKSGKVKLSDQKLEKIWEEYEAIRDLKKKEQFAILDKVFVVKESSYLMVDTFIAETKEFVRKQQEALETLDLKSLEEIVKQEKIFYANASEKIKKDTCLFNRLQETLQDQEVKIKISTELDENSHNDDVNDAVVGKKTENAPVKESTVVLYNIVESKNTDDCSLVKRFLAGLDFGEVDIVSVERIVQSVRGINKPLKVTFGNEEIVEKILKLPIGRTRFEGRYVRIAKI